MFEVHCKCHVCPKNSLILNQETVLFIVKSNVKCNLIVIYAKFMLKYQILTFLIKKKKY
jgi:hypothetical protein